MGAFRNDPAPVVAPVVYPASCLADPVEPHPVEEPPMPEALPRPAGNAAPEAFVAYATRRMERAELAGLFFQGERDAFKQAYDLTAEQLRQCVTFVRGQQ
jgi:hypothetical protein